MKIAILRFAVSILALALAPGRAHSEELASRAALEQRAHEIDSLIMEKRFDDVERVFAELASPKARKTRINDSPLFTVLGAMFEPSAPKYQDALKEWVATKPQKRDRCRHSRALAPYLGVGSTGIEIH